METKEPQRAVIEYKEFDGGKWIKFKTVVMATDPDSAKDTFWRLPIWNTRTTGE